MLYNNLALQCSGAHLKVDWPNRLSLCSITAYHKLGWSVARKAATEDEVFNGFTSKTKNEPKHYFLQFLS